eukprot:1702002-Alexandrium_andersonii.AAC.1
MSASLVGSEMCIRDRLTEVTGAGADSARDILGVFGKLGQLANEAVDLALNGIAVLSTSIVRGVRAYGVPTAVGVVC